MQKSSLIAIVFLGLSPHNGQATEPAWWTEQSTRILAPNGTAVNYAPANLGQLKFVATQAKNYLDSRLSNFGGAGPDIASLIATFEPQQGQSYTPQQIVDFRTANYAPLNLGQLKAVAKPFYLKLASLGYDTNANLIRRGYPVAWESSFPWLATTPASENYAVANLGQLKMVFSFDLSGDNDNDGLPDAWELQTFGSMHLNGAGDFDGDGISNAAEFTAGTPADDFYNNAAVSLQRISGNNQTVGPNRLFPQALVIELRDSQGNLLPYAPVAFSAQAGLLSMPDQSARFSSLKLYTDENARVELRYKAPTPAGTYSVIARAGQTITPFTETVSYNLPPLAPTNVQALPVTNGPITITWSDNSTDEQCFLVERRSEAGDWNIVGETAANETEFSDYPPSAEKYWYRVTSSYVSETNL